MTLEEAAKDLHSMLYYGNLYERGTVWAIGITNDDSKNGRIIVYMSKKPNTIISSHQGWPIDYIKATRPVVIVE